MVQTLILHCGIKHGIMLGMELKDRLKAARIALGLTPEQAAETAGVSWSYWYKLESGDRNNLTVGTAAAISNALQLSLADLFPELLAKKNS
jgi:transcriptional regulator with XRE-family HTH domain